MSKPDRDRAPIRLRYTFAQLGRVERAVMTEENNYGVFLIRSRRADPPSLERRKDSRD